MKKNNLAQLYCYLVMFAATVMLSVGLVLTIQFGLRFLPDGKYKLDYWSESRCVQQYETPGYGINEQSCKNALDIERESRKYADLVNNLSILLVGAGVLGGHFWVLKKLNQK